jgi:hypothetical protein
MAYIMSLQTGIPGQLCDTAANACCQGMQVKHSTAAAVVSSDTGALSQVHVSQ